MFTFFSRLFRGSKTSKGEDVMGDSHRADTNMTTNKNTAELRALVDLINASMSKIEAACSEGSQAFPLANEPFSPQTDAIRMSPDVLEAGSIMVAAAAQLVAAVRVPAISLSIAASSFHLSSCVRLAVQANVAEILREAGPQGLHVNDIAKPTGVDPVKLARAMRLLVTNHIFREVSPDVFTHNRISSLLDTGKPVASILENPENKHDGTMGIAAVIEHVTDDGFKAAAFFPETLTDPALTKSGEPNQTAFNTAFKTNLGIFPWLELLENAYRLKRFGIGMQGTQSMSPPGAILRGFDWDKLPKQSIVVDVGGGVGSHSLALAKAFDHINFVVQDRDAVIQDAAKFWDTELPNAVQSGRVKLQAHDFFKPQPVKAPAVFLMRMIMHDWSDAYCLKILTQLRDAAGPNTQLLIVDNIIHYACPDTTSAQSVPGAASIVPPEPLLANMGAANALPYFADIHMMTLLNGHERTIARTQNLLEGSKWRLVKVYGTTGAEVRNAKLIAVPA